jgi:Helix-turn-helix domain
MSDDELDQSDDESQSRRGPHKSPKSQTNQVPPWIRFWKPVRKGYPKQPPRSLAEPDSERRGPPKLPNSGPNKNPERRGLRKQTSQSASALANSSKVRNGSGIKAEPMPYRDSTGSGKPTRQRPAIRLTEAEVAKRLRVSPKTLRNWRSKGKGPFSMKIGGLIRYRLVDVEAFEKKGWSGCLQASTA